MKNIWLLILGLLLLSVTDSSAAATMLRMNRLDRSDLTQIFITFNRVPEHSYKLSGKRIDLVLEETGEDDDFLLLPADNSIVKCLINHHKNSTVLSFFLRYPPQKVDLAVATENQLVLDIITGNEYSSTYQNFSQKFSGLTVLRDPRTTYTSPLNNSDYATNWASFFQRYQPEVTLDIPIKYTLPKFPVLAQFPNSKASEEIRILISEHISQQQNLFSWKAIQRTLLAQTNATTDIEKQKQLALSYGEALLRDGNWVDAYKLFYLLAETYPDELIGFWAKYLSIYTTARYDDPFLAQAQATEFASVVPQTSTLGAYLHLLHIETALATKDFQKVKKLLAINNIAIPKHLYPLIEMRGGDYLHAVRKYIPAHITYLSVPEALLLKSPYSLAAHCDTLFRLKKYQKAKTCYQELKPQVSDRENSALIAYRIASTTLLTDNENKDRSLLFATIEDTYQGTEGSFLAAIKKNDLKFNNNPNWAEKAAVYYQALAEHALWRNIREECYFKEALTWHLLGHQEKALSILQKIRREFRTGPLNKETKALLLTILPGELRHLIAEKHYIKALTLARQHKSFFEKGWIAPDIFPDIAKAFTKSHLDHEAEKAYIYLYNIAKEEEKEDYFLLLIQAIFNQGKYHMVDDYASQYSYLYPQGKHHKEILHLRLNALRFLGKHDKAMDLLPDPLSQDQQSILFAASLAYAANDFSKTAALLDKLEQQHLGKQDLFILAESSFQNKNIAKAKKLFAELVAKNFHPEQAMYRLAEIARAEGDLQASRTYLEKLIATNNDSPWTQYAARTLKLMKINKTINTTLNNS